MDLLPYLYNNEKSIVTYKETEKYLEENKEVKEKIQLLGLAYSSVGHSVPQTVENFWSGHSFPFDESWDDIQISATLCFFGLYKQAFAALRSGLELGLLSVYYNLDDNGHETVKDWYYSLDGSDSNTPRADKIWRLLLTNSNIQKFNDRFNLKEEYLSLGYLHNYVHTKGTKFSNSLDGLRGNSQIFLKSVLEEWIKTFERIASIIISLHLLKYPLGLIEFNFYRKFGIDMPNVSQVNMHIETISSFLEPERFSFIKDIAKADIQIKELLSHLNALPDKSDEEIELQAFRIEQSTIKHYSGGFKKWEEDQLRIMNEIIAQMEKNQGEEYRIATLNRVEKMSRWAIENNIE